MKEQNNIEELFKDGFKNFEADPGANAWSGIQSRLQSGAAAGGGSAAAGGFSSWMATAIVGVIISATAIGGYFYFNQKGEIKKQQNQQQIEEQSIEVQPAVEEASPSETTTPPIPEREQLKEKEIAKDNLSENIDSNKMKVSNKIEQASTDEKVSTLAIEESESDKIAEESIDDLLNSVTSDNVAIKESATTEATENSANEKVVEGTNNVTPTEVETNNNNVVNSNEGNNTIEATTEEEAPYVEFPNTFTPNSDGTNDFFSYTTDHSDEIDNIIVKVFAANGKLINEINGLNDHWDGRLADGTLAPEGPYVYRAIIYKNGKEYLKKGTVRLRH